ncbi:MAG: DUF1800 family protein [Verrucomicrobiales bacterium]|nr:DUF1800 family protein [Verrucomicrobiales bacterium]
MQLPTPRDLPNALHRLLQPSAPNPARSLRGAAWAVGTVLFGSFDASSATAPSIQSIVTRGSEIVVAAQIPGGHSQVVLQGSATVDQGFDQALVAAQVTGQPGIATFRVPNPGGAGFGFLRIRSGSESTLPVAVYPADSHFSIEYTGTGGPLTAAERANHVLSRLAYGPTPDELQAVTTSGVAAFIEQQLNPAGIDEAANTELATREAALFRTFQPSEDTRWISPGDTWRYFKGTQAPPANWKDLDFADSGWLQGPTGIGYGDDDDATELLDMRQADGNPGYYSVFLRHTFNLSGPVDFDAVILSLDYDDGFVAYLNGTEVARANVDGNAPAYNAPASNDHEAGTPEEFDLSARRGLLRSGPNVLAIELHNVSLTSSDASIIPSLLGRKILPTPPQKRIRDFEALQQLVHVRGALARRQLQAVLAEFWDNHFTTDFDKVAEYFADLRDSNARRALSEEQAADEAAQAEYLEYQFFHDNALGNFGDLLLYSATSPTQLIYLDNVLNVKGAANENYAREILELFGFGVDNRYTQVDIEQLAKCFTGWTVRKISADQKQTYPASARTPPTTPNVQFQDTPFLDLGPGWKYYKGTNEPSPAAGGAASTAWTQPGFDATAWLAGSTGIGFGDNDDATVLSDMRNAYVSVYLRREFTLADPAQAADLILSVDYDDGFVAYLNGTEIARSETMQGTGTPPAFNRTANGGHEAGNEPESHSLRSFAHLLKPAPEKNVLAIQVHNIQASSSDLSMLPRLVRRQLLPGSIENSDPNGLWTFRFDPSKHDTSAKTLFKGTPYQIDVPAGRTGIDGLRDAVDIVDGFVNHPSTAEFICLKLINKFVSDEITLETYHEGTAPAELKQLLDEAIAAWKSTQPAGNIRTVLRVILKPGTQDGPFWARHNFRAKVKTPVEFINSSLRSLRATVGGTSLPASNELLGMHLFNRDEPDGWSEMGHDWIDTGTMLERIQFAQALPTERLTSVKWDALAWARANGITGADSVIAYFNRLLFNDAMAESNKRILVQFATTDEAGNPLPFEPSRADYAARLRELVGMILSMPQWHFQ